MKKEEIEKYHAWFKINNYLEGALAHISIFYFTVFTTLLIFYILSYGFFQIKFVYEAIGLIFFVFAIWMIIKYQFQRGLRT